MNELSLFTGAGGMKTCSKCGITHSKVHKHGGTWCATCSSAYSAEWRRRNKDAVNARIRARYALTSKLMKEPTKLYRGRLRAAVLVAYGSKCACCGESIEQFLTLDHVGGDGASHRKETNNRSIYKIARDEGFPSRYRLLCWNCNCSRGQYGYCPHERT